MTQSLAAELYDDGIAVNAAAPSKPVATPGAGTLDLAKEDTEDISLIVETAFRLCTGRRRDVHRPGRAHPAVPPRGGLAHLSPPRPHVDLEVTEVGDGDRLVVFVHGVLGRGRSFDRVADLLASECRMRWYDRRGYGTSRGRIRRAGADRPSHRRSGRSARR